VVETPIVKLFLRHSTKLAEIGPAFLIVRV
jgi:hypothetical protein